MKITLKPTYSYRLSAISGWSQQIEFSGFFQQAQNTVRKAELDDGCSGKINNVG